MIFEKLVMINEAGGVTILKLKVESIS